MTRRILLALVSATPLVTPRVATGPLAAPKTNNPQDEKYVNELKRKFRR
jgi:hypothetical protein